jgi:hypothetical protein
VRRGVPGEDLLAGEPRGYPPRYFVRREPWVDAVDQRSRIVPCLDKTGDDHRFELAARHHRNLEIEERVKVLREILPVGQPPPSLTCGLREFEHLSPSLRISAVQV